MLYISTNTIVIAIPKNAPNTLENTPNTYLDRTISFFVTGNDKMYFSDLLVSS